MFCFAVRDIFSRLFDDFATSDPSKNLARILWIHFKGKMFATNYISLIKYFTNLLLVSCIYQLLNRTMDVNAANTIWRCYPVRPVSLPVSMSAAALHFPIK